MRRSIGDLASRLFLLAVSVLIGCSPGEQPRSKIETVGDLGGVLGGGFTMGVTNDFNRPELEALYNRALSWISGGDLEEYTCGDPAPAMRYELSLEPQGEYNERLVNVGFAPKIDVPGRDRCLYSGISYLFNTAVLEIDKGEPIDYGYVNPSTGKPLPPSQRYEPAKPVCRCDLRETGRDWVAYSQKGADELE